MSYRLRPSASIFFKYMIAVLTVLSGITAFPQNNRGSISATVHDSQGAVVQGASVLLTRTDTNFRQSTHTDDQGYFRFPQIEAGHYRLRLHRQGFAILEVPSIVLNTSTDLSFNLSLKVANAHVDVVVQAKPDSGVDLSTATKSTIDRTLVENAPLNGRSMQSLLLLTPGTVLSNADGNISVNGMRTNQNNFTIDGVSANVGTTATIAYAKSGWQTLAGETAATNNIGQTSGMISIDALEEFTVQSSTYSAQLGRQEGGQIQMTTRSGTNHFHGSLFDYVRNDIFDAEYTYPTHPSSNNKSAIRQNDFGGTFGGPLWRDHTFFFVNVEQVELALPQPYPTGSYYVPSVATRDNTAINANLRSLMSAYPLPTGADIYSTVNGVQTPSGYSIWDGSSYSYNHSLSWSAKANHTFSPRFQAFFRYSDAPSSSDNYQVATNSHSDMHSRTSTLNTVATLKSSMVNALTVNYSTNAGEASYSIADRNVVPAESSYYVGVPNSVVNYTLLSAVAPLRAGQQTANTQRSWNAVDNLSYTHQNHSFTFGADYRYLMPKLQPLNYSMTATFSTLANLTSNAASSIGTAQQDGMTILMKNLSLFAQDSWRVNSKLSLNYGIRWEYDPAPHGRQPTDLRYVEGWQSPSTMHFAPAGTTAYSTRYSTFSPRFGISYLLRKTPGWETVMSGGWGLYYDLGSAQFMSSAVYYPHSRTKTLPVYPDTTPVSYPFSQEALSAPPALSFTTPYPSSQYYVTTQDNSTLPRSNQWNLKIQQSLGNAQSISIAYVGNAARHLSRNTTAVENSKSQVQDFMNANFPGGYFTIIRNDGSYGDSSDYEALQVIFQRRLTRGIQAFSNYTFSHAIDTASNDFTAVYRYGNGSTENTRGSSDNDRRHIYNLGFVYQAPSLSKSDHFVGNLVNDVLIKGWSISSVFKAQSGIPLNFYFTRGMYPYDAQGVNGTFRPVVVPDKKLWVASASGSGGGRKLDYSYFDFPSSCTTNTPQYCTNGNAPRNGYSGLGFWQQDVTVRREFSLYRDMRLTFSADIFNVYNHPNWGAPSTNIGSISTVENYDGTYTTYATKASNSVNSTLQGNAVSGGLTSLYQSGSPRSIQLALKLSF